jgi:hypothetical protein
MIPKNSSCGDLNLSLHASPSGAIGATSQGELSQEELPGMLERAGQAKVTYISQVPAGAFSDMH